MIGHFHARYRLGAALVATVLSSPVVAAAEAAPAGSPTRAEWFAAYHRDSRQVALPDGRTLSLYCVGRGHPTVVLEAGIGQTAFTWWAVQNKLAETTRVCAYDRAGMGKSPTGPFPRDTLAQVLDLEALLKAAHETGPYVVVGHSMGGYNVRVFAGRNLHDVAGMVLVDPSVEDQLQRGYAVAPAVAKNDAQSVVFLRGCADPRRTAETAENCTRAAPAGFTPELERAYLEAQGVAYFQTIVSEVEAFIAVDSAQVRAGGRNLGSMPLIVLTRGELSSNLPPDQAAAEWKLLNEMHDEVAALSPGGVNRIVKGAGHDIHIEKPEAVIDAVNEVLAKARRGAGR